MDPDTDRATQLIIILSVIATLGAVLSHHEEFHSWLSKFLHLLSQRCYIQLNRVLVLSSIVGTHVSISQRYEV